LGAGKHEIAGTSPWRGLTGRRRLRSNAVCGQSPRRYGRRWCAGINGAAGCSQDHTGGTVERLPPCQRCAGGPLHVLGQHRRIIARRAI